MAWLWWAMPTVSALAIPLALTDVVRSRPAPRDPERLLARDDHTIITSPESGRPIVVGETWRALTVYTVVSLSCAVALALFLGEWGFYAHGFMLALNGC